jgi:uncharacterized membrane protein
MTITDTLTIHAPADVVWALTEQVERWPELTPTMTKVERLDGGPLRVGSRARIAQPGLGSRTWTVVELDAPRRFAWQTRLGTVTMVGGHLVEPTAEGSRNTLTVELSGPGAGLLGRLARKKLAAAIHTENEGFRRGAEERGSSSAGA